MKRVYTIRLYQKHDMDLLSLRLRGVDLADAVHQSLAAFIEGRNMILFPPHATKSSDLMENNTATKVEKKMVLDDEDSMDVQIIDMLDRINEGSWNNFFKNLLRMYLWHPYAENYVKSAEDLKFFEERASIYKQNREIWATRKEIRRKPKSKSSPAKKEKKQRQELPKTEPVKKVETPVYDDVIDLDEWDVSAKETTKTAVPVLDTPTTAPNVLNKPEEPTSISYEPEIPEERVREPRILDPASQTPVEEKQPISYEPETSEDDKDDMDDITKAFSELLM